MHAHGSRISDNRVRLTAEHLLWMRVPRRYWQATFGQIRNDEARAVIGAYMRDIVRRLQDGDGLLMWGANGTGKTCAAVVVAKEARRHGASVFFIHAADLKRAAVETVPFDAESSIIDRARAVDLLVVDDLGKEVVPSGSGYHERFVEALFRARMADRRASVITTNVAPKDLADLYKPSLVEVLRESTLPIAFLGDSLRAEAAANLQRRVAGS